MSLLPIRTVHLDSDLPPAELDAALRTAVGERPGAALTGRVGDDGFVVNGVQEFRSTHMPLMRGSVAAGPEGGSLVTLRLRPPAVVIVFMAVWLGFLAAVAALIAAAHARGAGRSLLWLLAPGGLAALSWALMGSVFGADARWALEALIAAVPALRVRATPPAAAGNRRN